MKKVLLVLCMLAAAAVLFAGGQQEGQAERVSGFDRSETVFVTGGMWAIPTSFNPITWSVPAGLRGFVYESLFFYDPLTDEMTPWVAKNYHWEDDTLVLEIQETARWANGDSLTAEDVAFSIDYAAWSNPFYGRHTPEVDGNVVRIRFDEPSYHAMQAQLYTWPIIPKSYWSEVQGAAATDHQVDPLAKLGSGPYVIESVQQDRVVYLRDDNWWGKEALDMSFPAKRVVYLRSMANNVALGLLSQGRELDMANNFIPGTPILKRSNANIHTWYDDEPYMLPDNVVFLMPNTTVAPFDNADVRRAMAYAVNVEEIVDVAFENMAEATPNALGLIDIPAWAPYNNEDIARNYGFNYDPEEAKRILDAAGYTDQNGDGWRQLPDGTPIRYTLATPYGWTDWMGAARIIVENLSDVGLNGAVSFPDEGRWQSDMVKGHFELILQNWGSYISHSPYTIYRWLFSSLTDIGADEWSGNFGRYDNEELRDLVEEFAMTQVGDHAAGNEFIREIQKIHMQEMPAIPLWVNGMWFAANNSTWTNWPGENTTNKHYPSLFTDKLQVGGLKMLSEIELR